MTTAYDGRIMPGSMRPEYNNHRYHRRGWAPCASSSTGQDLYCMPCLDELFGGGYAFWYNRLVAPFTWVSGDSHAPGNVYSTYGRHHTSRIHEWGHDVEGGYNCRKPNGENRRSSWFVSREWTMDLIPWNEVRSGIRFPERSPSLIAAGMGL